MSHSPSHSPSTNTDTSTSSAGPHGASKPPGEEFFSRIRDLAVVRPDDGRWAAGVAAGLAHRWGVDPLLVRGGFVALSIFGGAGIALYGVCWLFLPQPDGRIHAQEVMQGRVTAGFVGSVIAILTNLPTTGGMGWHAGPFGWQPGGFITLALIGLGIWWFVARRGIPPWAGGQSTTNQSTTNPSTTNQSTTNPSTTNQSTTNPSTTNQSTTVQSTPSASMPTDPTAYEPAAPGAPLSSETSTYPAAPSAPSAPPAASAPTPAWAGRQRTPDLHAPSSALTSVTLGLAMLGAVIVVLLSRIGVHVSGYTWVVATSVALGVVALGIITAGLIGRRGGGLIPIAVLLAIASINGAAWHGNASALGQRTWTPTSYSQAQHDYELGAGNAILDLTSPALTTGATTVAPERFTTHMGAGRLRIVVPNGVAVEVDASVGLGQVVDRVNNVSQNGGGNDQVVHSGTGQPVLIVKADLGVGSLEILPQGSDLSAEGIR